MSRLLKYFVKKFAILRRYYHTLINLKCVQLRYLILNRLFVGKLEICRDSHFVKADLVQFQLGIKQKLCFQEVNRFDFLNIFEEFSSVDWSFSSHGKLWLYNLHYFDFLNQSDMTKARGLELMLSFIKGSNKCEEYVEPYPISLRITNWVKFLSRHRVEDDEINAQLYTDLSTLSKRIEYHILGNHLLENGFGMLFGAYYFKDERIYNISANIIRNQLKEQILNDGAHFELTPMYHQIMLYRILDSFQLVTRNEWKNGDLAHELQQAASCMLGWLKNIQFESGEIPFVNDSAPDIAPRCLELFEYATLLGIPMGTAPLGDSGYRFFRSDYFELLLDVGQIAPPYQPGHSHADNLQILLNYLGKPIVVDTGISTYEKNYRRQLERSTVSHNTVTVDRRDSSDVWSGFRVGRRAKTTIIYEDESSIVAKHDGYKNVSIEFQRNIKFLGNEVEISDSVMGRIIGKKIEGHLHFHPDINLEKFENTVIINKTLVFSFQGVTSIDLIEYQMAAGYNRLIKASKVIYEFEKTAIITICANP